MTGERFTADELRDCANRELRLRERTYPRLIQNHRMSTDLAERQIAMMEAIAALLGEHAKEETLFG